MSISVNGLRKNYGTQTAVSDLTFSVSPGEIVGFLGPNGAGKSTTMKMITGYLRPDGGTASVCGLDPVRDPLGVKACIGYLPESNPLYYDMYVAEYLGLVADMHRLRGRKAKVEDAVRLTGLAPERHKTIGQLSKGYKQRVGLAAALIHSPQVLILDEPTSGLDPNQIGEIRDVIRAQGAERTVLFSSHILQEVEALCDRVIIIAGGKLVANDRLEALRRGPADRVRVRFGEALEPEWLLRLPGVTSADSPDKRSWTLQTGDSEGLRKALLELSLRHNLNILSLQSESSSLEETFRELTQKASG